MTFVTYITKGQKSSLPMKFISRYINMPKGKDRQNKGFLHLFNGYFLNDFHIPCTVLYTYIY